jgi:hypothetical protein
MPVRLGIVLLAVSQLVLAIWQVADPGSFHDRVGDFGPRNDHYIRDIATWEVALAVTALVAVREARWRVPVLAFAALQFTLHTINHIADAGKAAGSTNGAFDAISLGIGALLLAALAWLTVRDLPRSRAQTPS